MKLNGNQPSAAETMKSIDNNHLLQIQEIKIDLHKSGEQEKYSEHDVNKVFHMKQVSCQYPPVNRYLVRDAICRKCVTTSLAIIIQYLRMLFGISPATEYFQRKLDHSLEGLNGIYKIANDKLITYHGASIDEVVKDHDAKLLK